MSNFLLGLQNAFQPAMILLTFVGVAAGSAIGSLPGLTATMGVAVLLPLTFGMDATAALVLLVGVYIGAIYGGSISAILLRTPGTPAAAATVLDGNALLQKGQAAKALSISVIASFGGGIVSTIMLVTLSPLLASAALRFSTPEFFGLAVFGLTIIASISGGNPVKGLLAGCLGLIVAMVGMDPITSTPRFTFGIVKLMSGLNVIPVLIGLFAVSEVLSQMESIMRAQKKAAKITDHKIINRKELRQILPTILKSSLLGTFIGCIPGAGADIASFVSYNEARRSSKHPEQFGTGCLEGIAAPEAGNNGVTGGAMVPMLSLGVPGDAVTAILLGALTIQGIQPGPLIFQNNGPVVYGLFCTMFLGNIAMLIMGLSGIRLFSKIVEIPKQIILPIILALSMVGSFAINNSVMDMWVALIFGVIGYFMKKANIPSSPAVLAIILGPMAETNLRRSVIMYEGSFRFLWTRPITIAFLLLSVISMISVIRTTKRARERSARLAQEQQNAKNERDDTSHGQMEK